MIESNEWNCKNCNLEFDSPNIDIATKERHCPNCYSIKIKKNK
jgi:predicted Zn-ribbon and HTH transcriptional regulator